MRGLGSKLTNHRVLLHLPKFRELDEVILNLRDFVVVLDLKNSEPKELPNERRKKEDASSRNKIVNKQTHRLDLRFPLERDLVVVGEVAELFPSESDLSVRDVVGLWEEKRGRQDDQHSIGLDASKGWRTDIRAHPSLLDHIVEVIDLLVEGSCLDLSLGCQRGKARTSVRSKSK